MKINIDTYIDLFKSLSSISEKVEMSEQDAAAGAGGTQNTNKRGSNWSELYSLKRGKANMLGKKGEKWSTGLTRGAANQLPGG